MDKREAINKLERQQKALLELKAGDLKDATYKKWKRDTEITLEFVFGKDSRHLNDFLKVSWIPGSWDSRNPKPAFSAAFDRGRQEAEAVLQSMVE